MESREELKEYCDKLVETLQPFFNDVAGIAYRFYNEADTITYTQYKPIEHKLVGIYTFINTKYKEVTAKASSCEAVYFGQLKCKSEIDRVKFVAEVAKRESEEYAKDLNLTSAILESWVNNIRHLLATCRGHFIAESGEKKYGHN